MTLAGFVSHYLNGSLPHSQHNLKQNVLNYKKCTSFLVLVPSVRTFNIRFVLSFLVVCITVSAHDI